MYDLARSNKQKPPNIKEIIEPVQNALRCKGFDTSGKHIQELAGAEEFKKQRRKPGRRSERTPPATHLVFLDISRCFQAFLTGNLATFLFSQSYLRVRW